MRSMQSFKSPNHNLNLKLTKEEKLDSFKKLVSLLWKHNKGWLLLAFTLVIFSAMGNIYNQLFLGYVIVDKLLLGTNPFNEDKFYIIICVSALIFLTSIICDFIANRIMISITYKTMTKLRLDLYEHIQTLPIKYFDSKSKGNLVSRFTSDIDTLRMFLSRTIITIIQSFITLTVSLTILFVLNWLLSLIMVALTILIALSAYIISKKSSKYFINKQKNNGQMIGYAEEVILGLKTIKMYGQSANVVKKFSDINKTVTKNSFKSEFISSIIWPLSKNLSNIAYALVIMIGAIVVITNQSGNGVALGLTIGIVVSFSQSAKSFSGPISTMTQTVSSFMLALAGSKRVFDILAQKSEINQGTIKLVKVINENDKYTEVNLNDKDGFYAWKTQVGNQIIYQKVQGKIEFKNVYFKYNENDEKYTLKDISFVANPGVKIAFVGPTGAGKTTIVNLITRFYEVTNGVILYDNIPIENIDKYSLRKSIGYVLQETRLFTDTIQNNITYGSDLYDEQMLSNVSRTTNLFEHIEKLDDKYSTMLTNSSSNLSQGQKQLISIARASYKNPIVLILDEATSNIDTHTEFQIEKATDKLLQNKTSFIIAHRLSTVKNATKIIVINDGQIIEQGSHDELIKNKNLYAQLWEYASNK
ncbi:ABC transporter ATP-binding protein [Mycoplasma sp. 1199]|uniref:ABC transporter ATP-binding protein n=1 Tax=Mycoplasma sp. 1199 TaxID=3108526 RepID=UPI002B1D4DF3|nr:ABC transporter ATP-binding protein [Mycoplasma sp. 1199]MEA4206137.1 ABC transporter ATP-binding protein [Mycoplasma sp. 1199]